MLLGAHSPVVDRCRDRSHDGGRRVDFTGNGPQQKASELHTAKNAGICQKYGETSEQQRTKEDRTAPRCGSLRQGEALAAWGPAKPLRASPKLTMTQDACDRRKLPGPRPSRSDNRPARPARRRASGRRLVPSLFSGGRACTPAIKRATFCPQRHLRGSIVVPAGLLHSR